MCGRYESDAGTRRVVEKYMVTEVRAEMSPRYNIAPSQQIAAVYEPDGDRVLDGLRWGLIPSWAKDDKIGNKMINARAETIAEKPSFRSAIKRRRCIIPATSFYEWRREGETKTPMNIHLPGRELFGFAGLWEEWKGPDGPLRSCTIITTSPNQVMESIHNRMPVIMPDEHIDEWLDPRNQHVPDLLELLQPWAGEMEAHLVSTRVNRPAYDAPDCIEALTD